MSMMAWLTETLHAFDLTWTALLWGLVSFLGMSIGSIAVVACCWSSCQPPIFVTPAPMTSGAIGIR